MSQKMHHFRKGKIMINSSIYLINENFVAVYPSLAKEIGLNEAIILQQIHYWIKDSKKVVDGRKWTYNSVRAWQEQLPFYSQSTIRRTFKNLEDEGLIISGNFNKASFDRTKWYTIDYAKLNKRVSQSGTNTSGQNEQMGVVNLGYTVPNSSSNSSANSSTKRMSGKPDLTPYSEIIDYMNNLYGSHFKAKTNDTRKKIRGRFDDGFTLNDFKLAIAGQWLNWKDSQKMRQHLVPKTIFRASNFEGYVEDAKRRKDIKQDLAIAKQDQANTDDLPF